MKSMNKQKTLKLFILALPFACLFPAPANGSPSYKSDMWRLLSDLKIKSITDGCVADDIDAAKTALRQNPRIGILDQAELYREGGELTMTVHAQQSGLCTGTHTYTQSIEIEPAIPSCAP